MHIHTSTLRQIHINPAHRCIRARHHDRVYYMLYVGMYIYIIYLDDNDCLGIEGFLISSRMPVKIIGIIV